MTSYRTTGEPPAGAASVESIYDSTGLVHALRRRPSPFDLEEVVMFFYLAGRPVCQVATPGLPPEPPLVGALCGSSS